MTQNPKKLKRMEIAQIRLRYEKNNFEIKSSVRIFFQIIPMLLSLELVV